MFTSGFPFWSESCPRNISVVGLNALMCPSSSLPTSRAPLKSEARGGRRRHAPKARRAGPRGKTLDQVAVQIEHVDDTTSARRILIGHVELAAEILDVVNREASGKVGIGELPSKRDVLERPIICVDLVARAVGGVEGASLR